MSRTKPPEIPYIACDGICYRQVFGKPGMLYAYNEKTGNKIWELPVYRCPIISDLETDLQEIYFKSMKVIENGKLLFIENENSEKFSVDLAERKLINNKKP